MTAFRTGIPAEELDSLYRQSRVYVSTSDYEGFHAPPMEAYLRGTRLVLPKLDVYRDAYGDARGIHWYRDDAELPHAISEALAEGPFQPTDSVVRSVSFDRVGQQLREIYESLDRR